jgi:predicted helicase
MPHVNPPQQILTNFRGASFSERKKGTYFEEPICLYFRYEPQYAVLYGDDWMLADVAEEFKISKTATGIDIVTRSRDTGAFHASQRKFCAEDYRIPKSDIDNFFTACGQKPSKRRLIVNDANLWATETMKNPRQAPGPTSASHRSKPGDYEDTEQPAKAEG